MLHKKSLLIAKILIFTSFVLFISGIVISHSEKIQDPSKAKLIAKEKNNITITPVTEPEENTQQLPTDVETEDNTSNNNSDNYQENNITESYENTPKNDIEQYNTNPITPNIEEANNKLRKELEENFAITIYYGTETLGYQVGGLSTYPATDANTIQKGLIDMSNTISKYPTGFFQEMKKGGIPLIVRLIQSYSNNGVTGVTNASNSKAEISISLDYPFAESFNHEVFHYIEKYITKLGGGFSNWNTLNPSDFKYGNINNSLSYNRTFSENAYFVNNYAQTSEAEDRASSFEYMMAQTKANCLNYGNTINLKSRNIAEQIDLIYTTVSPNRTEYWERFIY